MHEHVVVGLHDVGGARAVAGHPLQHHHRLDGQVVVRVDEVLLDDVAEPVALLRHQGVEGAVGGFAEEEEDAQVGHGEDVLQWI